MADKCIGKLTLDISDVEKKIDAINQALSGIGKNASIKIKIAEEVKAQIDKIYKELEDGSKRISETANKAVESIKKIGESKVDNTKQEASIQRTLALYDRLYNARNKLYELEQKGQQNTVAYAKATADVEKYERALSHIAETTKKAAQSRKEYEDIIDKSVSVKNAAKITEEEKEVEKATQAYMKLLEAKSKVKQLEIEGKQDTQEYVKATQNAGKAYDAFIKYSEGARESAKASREAAQARKDLNEIEAKVSEDSSKVDYLGTIKQQYFELTDAIKNYNAAKKAGDETGMANAQARIDASMQEVAAIQEAVNASNLEAGAKQQILNYIQQCTTAEHQHSAEIGQSVAKTGELESQVQGLVTRYLSLLAVIRAISSLIGNMVEYVSEYSDKMNEIQMITMKTDAEVANLAKTYRNLAKDMSVSSLDMADAAIYFTRQGLGAAEIEKRLKNVTMYAKAANVEFKDASEIITAVVNSMGLVEQEAEDGREAAQRVADVFLNIGDHAATSGQEIGEAMQKAAASAGAFGVSMEWLASYIATVSETTRQEARTIGTAFNTIIARLHQIKTTGYNQEDETKVNDIAKALSKIDIVLMDQEGNWRDMEVILEEIAEKWGTLDGKTKSYIATTMAGVKQQNVFLALMNDMSKGAENGSRAFELHALAMDSVGIAAEKYGVYLDSVTASQERLTVAQEKFYSILNEDIIKGWNDALAGFINMLTSGAEAWGNWTIIVPVVAGVIAAVVVAIQGLNMKLGETVTLMTLLEKHPVMMAISAAILVIGGLVTIINAIASSVETADEKLSRLNNTISESQNKVTAYESQLNRLDDMFADISKDSHMSSDEIEKYNDLLNELSLVSPRAAEAVENLKNNVGDQKEAYEQINAELERYINNEQIIQSLALSEKAGVTREQSAGEKFASAIMEHGHLGSMSTQERFSLVEHEFSDDIRSLIEDLVQREYSWDQIEKLVAAKFMDGMNETDYLAKVANSLIDEYINAIGMSMNSVDKTAVRSYLSKMIFGEDGILDFSEYQNLDTTLKDFIDQALLHGFDPQDLLGTRERIELIGENLFGDMFDMMFGDQLDDLMSGGEADLFVDKMSAAISDMISLGFSDIEIGDALRHIDLSEWVNVVDAMKQKLIDEIKNNAGVEELGFSILDLVTGEETYDQSKWDELDVSTLKLVNDLVIAGAEFDKIKMALDQSESVDEFKTKLNELSNEMGISGEEAEEAAKSLSDVIKAANAGIKDIQAIDAAIESVKKSMSGEEKLNYGDIFGLVELHPEIMTVIGDSEKLLVTLKKIREEAGKKQEESFVSMLLDTSGIIQNTQYADSGFSTLGEYRKSIEGDETALKAFDAEILVMAQNLQLADENYKQMSKDAKEAENDAKNALKEAQKAFKENLSEVETLDKVIAKLQSNKTVDFSDIINLSTAHPEIVAFANDADKLIAVLQRLKDEAKGSTKESIKSILYDSEEYFKGTQYYNPDSGVTTMKEYINSIIDARGNWSAVAKEVDQAAEDIVNAADRTEGAAESWLEAQAKIAAINEEVNWAKSNNFEDQINQLQEAVETGGIQEAISVFNGWSTEMKNAIYKEYPEFIKILGNADQAINAQGEATRDLTADTNNLNAALSKAEKLNNVKHFKDSAKAIKQLAEGTISASDAYDVYTKDLNKVTKAYEDILDVQAKMEYNAKEVNKDNQQAIDAADVNNLATLLGLTTDEILADFPSAVDMFNELIGKTGELQTVIDELNKNAFIRILGVSESDFSDLENGLLVVQNLADEAVQKLLATGQWTTESIPLSGVYSVYENGKIVKKPLEGYQDVLKPTGNNPFKGASTVTKKADTKQKSGRSGGGGGGSSSDKNKNFRDTNTNTEVERMLDLMSQVNSIQGAQQNWYQSQQKYYSQTKQLQGVIAYMQKEKEVLEAQNPVLEKNIQQIEYYMAIKKSELAALSTDDEAYKEVADDLDKLQKAHQTYTRQLIDNKTAIDQLTESMKEQQKKIRQMEIDLRNTILKAIEDREKKREDMLNAEIQMENKILELIKRRYEKERDEILNTTQMKIDALKEERDLLQEQLNIRKAEAEEADKAAKLKELEVKYQRIIADPTRAKEAQSLKKQIDDLRKEMAWDLAEKEVEAQQESIDQQITSLEDYQEYITNFYEDLFEHPQQLIDEMRGIIMGTQEEILTFLKENDDEYQNSSENTRTMLVTGWTETYNEMRGIIKTYWEEVEYIISQGEDYIIEFLKNNSADYAKAGKLQAEAYVDEWKEQLSNLKKAHEQVVAQIAANYSTINQYTGGSGSSGSSGSRGSSGSSGGKSRYKFNYNEKEYSGYSSYNDASSAISKLAAQERNQNDKKYPYGGTQYEYWNSKIGERERAAKLTIAAYAKGGLASFTGPAWLDGTQQDPERVLSPYQTKLFESMVQALEQMSRISIQPMQNYVDVPASGTTGVSVGDIVVNVDNLDTEDDYEEMADKVCEILMERIGQTAAIGGLRIRSV